jgi:hypothetical protein
MNKANLLKTVKTEFMRHSWDTFVEDPPSLARGGSGAVVQCCPRCRKRLDSNHQFMQHLADDVLPPIMDLVLTLGKSGQGSPRDQQSADGA